MTPEPCTLADFDQIRADLPDFWGDERTRPLHHITLVREFGSTAFVVRDGGRVVAYLMGFLAQTGPYGYVHLLAVRSSYRGRGLARSLYTRFIQHARERGCREIRAITQPTNAVSIAFHRRLGMELSGEPNADGIPVVKDYNGPGQDRVLFRMRI